MRKVIEWKRRNNDGTFESHFMFADDYHAGFSVEADGVTWRVTVNEYEHEWVNTDVISARHAALQSI